MDLTRIGYGQVEPNQLSAQKTGQIYASLPLDPDVKVLQNGEFMYYDYAANMVVADPDKVSVDGQEPMLVFNEIKIYEDWLSYKDFAMIRVGDNYVTNNGAVGRVTSKNTDGTTYGEGSLNKGAVYKEEPVAGSIPVEIKEHSDWQAGYRMDGIAPRLFKTNIGDIFTTNMVKPDSYEVKDLLKPELATATDGTKTLVLSKSGTIDTMTWVVVKTYTMPDGQPAVKIQRIK